MFDEEWLMLHGLELWKRRHKRGKEQSNVCRVHAFVCLHSRPLLRQGLRL